jgi:hypothetical protein
VRACGVCLLIACQPQDVHDDNFVYDNACNCYKTVQDNPVLKQNALLTSSPYLESATATGDTWAFNEFDMRIKLVPQIPPGTFSGDFAVNDSTGSGFLALWPETPGTWDSAGIGQVQMPWEVHGARLGHFVSRVTPYKLRSDSTPVQVASATDIRLVNDGPEPVYVVPIQVVLVLPNYSNSTVDPIKESLLTAWAEGFQNVLWDDRWTAKLQRVTHPGGLTAQVQGQWQHRSTLHTTSDPAFTPRYTAPFGLPDDIWGPPSDPSKTAPTGKGCRIQFRMVAFQKQYQDREHFELIQQGVNGNDVPLCDNYAIGPRIYDIVQQSWQDPAFRSDLPVVVFNWTIQPPTCFAETPIVDLACDPEVDGQACNHTAGWIGVGAENIQEYGATDTYLVLAHELGHVLGLDDVEDSVCLQPNKGQLMCHGPSAPIVPFVPPESCAMARSWAYTYQSRYTLLAPGQ